jgi:hypothetical protein
MKTIERSITLIKSKLKGQTFPTKINIYDDNTYEINEVFYLGKWNKRGNWTDEIGFTEKNVYGLCVWWWILQSFAAQYGNEWGLKVRPGKPLDGTRTQSTGTKIVMPIT